MWPFRTAQRADSELPALTAPKQGHTGQVSPQAYTNLFDNFDGSKFFGGFGKTAIYNDGTIDYDLLRKRSKQLFIENSYAKGLINRITDNVINTGLRLQTTPENEILDLDSVFLQKWTDKIEASFRLWGNNPLLVDHKKAEDFGALQRTILTTALLSGDCLVRLRTPAPNRLPTIEIIDGKDIKTPFMQGLNEKKVKHGIEFDGKGRQVAYYVQRSFDSFQRIPAFGEKSGRRLAWLVYGSRKLLDHTRGISLLACALQALKEVDRYTDSENRAAVLNSYIATFIKRDANEIGTTAPYRAISVTNEDHAVTQPDVSTKKVETSEFLPGMMFDRLEAGEEPVSFDTRRPNVNFKEFVRAILAGIAWGQGIPPEILFLEFQNNFSASRQASNEFNMYLKLARSSFSKQVLRLYWIEWLTQYALLGKSIMPGFVQALNSTNSWEIKGAWSDARWIGVARPSVDPLKEIKAYATAVAEGFLSKSDVITELRGDDFDKVLRRRKNEKEKEIEAGFTAEKEEVEEVEKTEETEEIEEDKENNLVEIGA